MGKLYEHLPTEIKNIVKEVVIEYDSITKDPLYGNMTDILTMNAKMFIPGIVELGYNKNYGDFGEKFPYFTSTSRRLLKSVSGYTCEYWTRSGSSETGFYYIPSVATTSLYPTGQANEHYVIACICI